jgi:mono/diheme cytochrome c family protein
MFVGVACSSTSDDAAPTTGPAIYREVCATCHGREGGGFVGPSLVDVAARYPDIADEIALVTNGSGQMPAFGTRLSDAQIATVVAYTREEFSSAPATTTTSGGPPVGPPTPTTSTG